MVSSSFEIRSLAQLRAYVSQMMCQRDQLEPDAFTITERILMQKGEPCGIYFCLHGPRAVKLSAIWETKKNTILFYGPSGERFHKTQLVSSRKGAMAYA